MEDNSRTRHEKAMTHLRSATRALEHHRKVIEDAAQAHLDNHPTVESTPTIADSPVTKESTNG